MTIDEAIDRNVELKGELVEEGRLEKAEGIHLGNNALIFYRRLKALNTGEVQGNFLGETE